MDPSRNPARFAATGHDRYAVPDAEKRQLVWEDLLDLRHRGGLPGHAEEAGKTLVFKANTGPSGHGGPPSVGIAMALKAARADGEVKVFSLEGEGGLTAGAHHEARLTAWGMGLGNLNYLVDWNDYGIDPRPYSQVMYGDPQLWSDAYGWRTRGTGKGHRYDEIVRVLCDNVFAEGDQPRCSWFNTVKGRGYGVEGYASHGAALPPNSELFWKVKAEFAEKYGLEFEGMGQPRPETDEEFRAQTAHNMQVVLSLLDRDGLGEWLADKLVEIGDSVPDEIPGLRLSARDFSSDPEVVDPERLPKSVFFEPGEKQPNRKGLAKVGAYLNAVGRRKYGRPLVIACSADLAESTNIVGFAQGFGDSEGWGWYQPVDNPDGALLPTAITEFGNAGLMCGLASTNLAADPEKDFVGFWGACSTYGSFSYLKYGPMRLYSQLVQDSPYRKGKVIWIAGHSGPETAEDSRTHFGIFSPVVTQLFPRGQTIDLHPWEPNEVGPALLTALGTEVPIVALHLTRPPVEIPDREALGMDSHMMAARGAYLIRDYDPERPKQGCIFVRGTSSTASVVELLKAGAFEGDGPNVKLVAAVSEELFRRQPEEWRNRVVTREDWFDSTFITNGARIGMTAWTAHSVAAEYAMSSDWDDRWRTGGSLSEVIQEARLDPESLLEGIQRFAEDREERFARAGAPKDLARA